MDLSFLIREMQLYRVIDYETNLEDLCVCRRQIVQTILLVQQEMVNEEAEQQETSCAYINRTNRIN